MRRWISLGVLITLLNAAPLSAKELPEGYTVLAKHLCESLRKNSKDFKEVSMSELIARGHEAILELQSLELNDTELKHIREKSLVAFKESVKRLEKINSLPLPPNGTQILGESFGHLLVGEPLSGVGVALDANAQQKALRNELNALLSASEQLGAMQLLLVGVAKKHSPESENSRLIEIDYLHSWNIWGPDMCFLTNHGKTLKNCTIEVIVESGSEKKRNVHFIPIWESKTQLTAKYERGLNSDSRVLGGRSVVDAEKVKVIVYSKEYSGSAEFELTAKRRTEINQERVKSVAGKINPRIRGSFVNKGSVLVVENKLDHQLKNVKAVAKDNQGGGLGEVKKSIVEAGGKFDVGNLQIQRNLRSGDTVDIWIEDILVKSVKVP